MFTLFIAFCMALLPGHSTHTTKATAKTDLSRLQITVRADTSDPTGDSGHLPPLPIPIPPIK
ncbi:MAG: hypothetical protein J7539_14330 [Niabella sp.]|nr:hypothetical protein [Niabella sp.]